MLIRKSRISQLIKKEREKERRKCEKENTRKMHKVIRELESEYSSAVKMIKKEHDGVLTERDRTIMMLKRNIEKNYDKYQVIRQREKHLDQLSNELEDTVESMVIKVQESVQPFYRTRGKVQSSKRRSDKKHEKVESIFYAVK
ncbi:MAG: hypothetical protein GY754_43160 [bacterium]|nr:hypothetical protein [bacterium]